MTRTTTTTTTKPDTTNTTTTTSTRHNNSNDSNDSNDNNDNLIIMNIDNTAKHRFPKAQNFVEKDEYIEVSLTIGF